MPCDRGGGERGWEDFPGRLGGQQQQAGDFVLLALAAFEYTQTQARSNPSATWLVRHTGRRDLGSRARANEIEQRAHQRSRHPRYMLLVLSMRLFTMLASFQGASQRPSLSKDLASLSSLFLFFLFLHFSHAVMLADRVVPTVPRQYRRRKGGKRKGWTSFVETLPSSGPSPIGSTLAAKTSRLGTIRGA